MTQLTGEFKETEVGYVPTEWNVAPLSTVSVKTVNRNPSNAPNVTFRYIDVSSVSNETFQVTGYSDILGKDAPSRARRVVKADDTIFATVRPYLMNIARIPGNLNESICSTGFCVIRADTGKADSRFLYFCVVSHPFVQKVVERQRGSSYPAVRDKDVLEQYIPLPPLDEQRRIAAVLTAIQDAVAAQEDVIAAARAFKRSLMHRLFTYGPGRIPAETKETEIGEIPSHWDMVELGEVSKSIRYGTSKRCSEELAEFPVLRIPNVIGEKIDITNLKYTTLPKHEVAKLRLEDGDLLFVRTNGQRDYIGRSAVFHSELANALYASYLIRVRLDSQRIDSDFVNAYLATDSGRDQLIRSASGTADGKFNVNSQIIRATKVILASSQDQKAIVDAQRKADAKIAAEEDRKAALDALFKSMLHQLMTGQIRLLKDEGLSVV